MRSCDCGVAGAVKNGVTVEAAAREGDNIGGLLDGFEAASTFIQGFEERFSDTADMTGEGALGAGAVVASSLPSA